MILVDFGVWLAGHGRRFGRPQSGLAVARPASVGWRVLWADEPDELDAVWRATSARHDQSHKLWTNDYLAACAQAGDLTLATLDANFRAVIPQSEWNRCCPERGSGLARQYVGCAGGGQANGSGPCTVARARPALEPPSDPEVAQEPVGVLQRCRAGNRVAGGGRVRLGRGAGRIPVQ